MKASAKSLRARRARKFVRFADETVNLAVLAFLLFLLCCGCYSVWDSKQVYRSASAVEYEIYRPSGDDTLSFEQLRNMNEDVFGWITVYGTAIDYPLVQGKDNWEYLNKSSDGKHSLTGSIFLDSKNSRDFSDYNTIIHGHHMTASAMFGDLDKFGDGKFFDEHRFGSIFFDGTEHGVTFFAYTVADAYDSDIYRILSNGSGAKQAYLDGLMQKALHSRDCGQYDAKQLVLLSTCASDVTNGRSVLAGFITESPAADPFRVEKTDAPRAVRGLDPIRKMTDRAPLWIWLLVLLVFLTAAYIVESTVSLRLRKAKALRIRKAAKAGNANEAQQ